MEYKKPEIALLDTALTAIQGSSHKLGNYTDPQSPAVHSSVNAYEADE